MPASVAVLVRACEHTQAELFDQREGESLPTGGAAWTIAGFSGVLERLDGHAKGH
jgi:hypothetical protein